MKKIFFAVVALAAMSSCAKENTVMEAPRQAIAFGDVFVDNATRADYSDGNQKLTSFNVYGTVTGNKGTVNIFDEVEVTGTVGGTWSYNEQYAQHWVPGADYDFAAVVDANVAKDASNMPETLTTIPDANSNLEDMLYATAHVEDAADNQGAVNFTFSHLLSKVKFTVTSNAKGEYYHTITDIKVSNFETGTYTINGGTWAGNTVKEVAFAEIEEVTSADTDGKSNTDKLLVPNAATFNVTFTVNLYKGEKLFNSETKTIPVTIKNAEDEIVGLQKGNAYNFVINCEMGKPIQFNVANDPEWTTQPGVTIQ